MPTVCCVECRYWSAFSAGTYGECRRHAPLVVVHASFNGKQDSQPACWPITEQYQWCGDGDQHTLFDSEVSA